MTSLAMKALRTVGMFVITLLLIAYIKRSDAAVPRQSIMTKQEYATYLKRIKDQASGFDQGSFRSSYECLGLQNRAHTPFGRSCVFHNICTLKSQSEFYYLQPQRSHVFYDAHRGPMDVFPEPFIALDALSIYRFPNTNQYFTPKVIQALPTNYTLLKGLHVLWDNWAPDFNLGHLVWEEMGSVFVNMHRLGIYETHAKWLNKRQIPSSGLFQKFTQFFGPPLTSKPMESLESALKDEAVCFETLFVNSAQPLFLNPDDQTHLGKEPLFRLMRDKIMAYYGLDPEQKISKTVITFMNKTDSIRNAKRNIHNLKEVIAETQKRFPTADIRVLDPTEKSLKDQLYMLQETQILITPCGGISMIGPFLPVDATILIMDYHVDKHDLYNALIPYQIGDSGSMEASFWNLFPHLRVRYYQILHESELFYHGSKTNARDEASVIRV
ncbi:hypothetical protein EDD86DRAFT_276518 [Gorgonomyces haynaldii]|nr:hypothetical protein EDD86DRAFT_276518 [Gorgonomyces haynaldii]